MRLVKKLLEYLPLLVGTFFASLNLFHYAPETTLGADIVSRVLPAVAPRLGLGVHYKDYWEITPPIHILVLDIWSRIFGYTPLSIKLLHFLVSLAVMFLIYLVLKRIFRIHYLLLITVLTYYIIFSSRLISFILPAELLALLFSLGALAGLLYISDYRKALFLGGLLFFFSSQIKDPFGLAFLAVIPYLLYIRIQEKEKFLSALAHLIGGIVLGILTTYLYLILLGSLKDYLLVLTYKSNAYKFFEFQWLKGRVTTYFNFVRDIFLYFNYSIYLPLFLYFTVNIFGKIKRKWKIFFEKKKARLHFSGYFSVAPKDFETATTAFCMLGLALGFVAQKSLGAHYYIQIVLPVFVYLGLCFQEVMKELKNINKKWRASPLLFAVVFLYFLIPEKSYFVDYHFERSLNLRFLPKILLGAETNQNLPIEEKIESRVSKDSCILHVYGWGVGSTYLYSKRKPCTRFFLPNLVSENWQKSEYRDQLLSHPPAAILYTTKPTDLDVERFERDVFNFAKVIKFCYTKDDKFPDLYWPRVENNILRSCLQNNL